MNFKLKLVALLFLGLATTANASNILEVVESQRVDIEEGYRSGKISATAANDLIREQKRINRLIRKAEKDGVITERERSKILRLQRKAEKNIYQASNYSNRSVRSSRYRYYSPYSYGASIGFGRSRGFRGGFRGGFGHSRGFRGGFKGGFRY